MSDENNANNGSLEKRGIQVETQIDPNVLSSSAAKAIRFRLSKPSGYALSEVDDFVRNIVQTSIDWYNQTIYERDKTVHYLGEELDKAETDIANLKSQIQFLEYNGQIEKGISQNSDDKEMVALMEKLATSEKEITSLHEQLNSINNTTETNNNNPEQEAYIEQITTQYNELFARYNEDVESLQTQLEGTVPEVEVIELKNEIKKLKVYTKDLDDYISSLEHQTTNNHTTAVSEKEVPETPISSSPSSMLPSEEKDQNTSTSTKYGVLPDGIRIDDLE